MKKTLIIIFLVALLTVGSIIGYYVYSLSPVSKSSEEVVYTIKPGASGSSVATDLKKEGLIKNEFTFKLYLKLHNAKLQAGSYKISASLGVKDLINKFNKGDVFRDTVKLIFIEGKTLKKNLEIYSNKMGFETEEMLNVLNDKAYLNTLISKYWFLTDDILNTEIYYPLEGYLFPDTYEFEKTYTFKECLEKQLDNLNNKLTPLKEKIESSGMSIHDLLSLASMVELEANTPEHRALVAGVFLNRINANMNLGSDVTTYYAEQVEMGSVPDLYKSQYNAKNAYNTRNTSMLGLPVSPICNPSLESITASIIPTRSDYLYFFAVNSEEVLYAKTLDEHVRNVNK